MSVDFLVLSSMYEYFFSYFPIAVVVVLVFFSGSGISKGCMETHIEYSSICTFLVC